MAEPSQVVDHVARADFESLRASWSFGMDITNLRPGAWSDYMNERFDEILGGLEDGGGEKPEPEPEPENGAR